MLVRQFRIDPYVNGDPPRLLEACSGIIEGSEDPADSVRREMEEEAGYRIHDLRRVLVLYMSPGGSTERQHL